MLPDATELEVLVSYKWKDWCSIRSSECMFLWNDYVVLELSNVSNGWFRYLMDNKVATMYSSGSVEGGPDSFDGKSDFIDKFQRCCSQVTSGTIARPILSNPLPLRLIMGNWSLTCKKEEELVIYNAESSQVLLHVVKVTIT